MKSNRWVVRVGQKWRKKQADSGVGIRLPPHLTLDNPTRTNEIEEISGEIRSN